MHLFSRLVWLGTFGMVSLALLIFGVGAWHAYDSRHWPTTDGVVVAFYERPNYKYTVAQKSYTANNVSCNEFFDR